MPEETTRAHGFFLFLVFDLGVLLRRWADAPRAAGHREHAGGETRQRRFRHEALHHEQQHREAERPHVLLVERGLDALRQLLAHHALQAAGHLVDAGLAALGAHDRAAGGLRDLGELRFALGGELGGERKAVVVAARAGDLAVGADLGNGLRRATTDLHDIDARLLLGGGPRDGHGVAFEIFAVGHEHDDAHVLLRLRVARQELARTLQRPRDGGAAHGHVVRLELAERTGRSLRRRW